MLHAYTVTLKQSKQHRACKYHTKAQNIKEVLDRVKEKFNTEQFHIKAIIRKPLS